MIAHIGQRGASGDVERGVAFVFVAGLIHVNLVRTFSDGPLTGLSGDGNAGCIARKAIQDVRFFLRFVVFNIGNSY